MCWVPLKDPKSYFDILNLMHPFFQVKNHGECQRIESSVHIWTKKTNLRGAVLQHSKAAQPSWFHLQACTADHWSPCLDLRTAVLLSEIHVLIRYVNVVIQGNDPISYPLISEKMFMLELLFVDRTSPVPSWNIRYTKWRTANTLNSSNVWFRSLNLLSSNFVQRRIPIQKYTT